MLVVYLLLFLHLSASTCGATSRNHRIFLPGGAAAPAPSPAIHDHRNSAKQDYLSYYDVHYHPAMMARRGGPPPRPSPSARVGSGVVEGAPPPPPGVEASGIDDAPPPPPEKEDGAGMEPLPSPPPHQQVDDGGGGGEGGTSSEVDTGTDDVAVDYEGPKTHPPSHN